MPKAKHILLSTALVVALGAIAIAIVHPSSVFAPDPVARLKNAANGIVSEGDRLSVQAALLDFEKSQSLAPYFADSFGCAVFPTIGKGGLGVGAAHGAGWVFRRGELEGMTKMTQVTVGFQAGVQAYSQIIFFEDEAAYLRFTTGNFELGAQASAVALTIGANASASTAGGASAGARYTQAKSRFTEGLAVFTLAKGGLMYEATVGGQKFTFTRLP